MNTYKAFYNGRTMDVQANTSYEAQCKAALLFRVGRKTWMVTVMLVAKGDEPVVHTPVF
jgi:hypothetical protein